MPVALFTIVLYHGTKPHRHGRATVTARYPEWPSGLPESSTDGYRYVLSNGTSHVRRQSFHTLREISNA